MPTIRTTQRRANAEAAFREIQSIADFSAHAVVVHPANQRRINASLINQVLNESADRVFCKRRDDRRVEPKAAFQPARHVVFAAALTHGELPRRPNPIFAGIEPQHHFPETHLIPAAAFFLSHYNWHRLLMCSSSAEPASIYCKDVSVHIVARGRRQKNR